MKKLEHDLLGEADIKTPVKKETKPVAKVAQKAEDPKIKMPKLGDHVLFRKAENGDVVEHLAIVMSAPQSSTTLSLNVLKQGYMDFVKSAVFSEEKQPHTWGYLDKN